VPELWLSDTDLENASYETLVNWANQVGIGHAELDEQQLRTRLLTEGIPHA
jgi:hypothetical protein